MLVLLMLPLLFVILLVLLRLDTCLLLHLAQPERVRHEGLICRLLLLFDCEEGVFADLGSHIAGSVGILSSDEVPMRSTELESRCQ